MLGLTATPTKSLTIGTTLLCDDNSGAKMVAIIGVKGYRARLRSYPKAGETRKISKTKSFVLMEILGAN